jgi:monofunctional biosynthetic peptidoglycan transglycosylase
MREMRSRLKSAGERLKQYARFPAEPAAFLRGKADLLREKAQQWRNGKHEPPAADYRSTAEGYHSTAGDYRPTAWPALVADSVAPAAPVEAHAEAEQPSGWAARLRMAGIMLAVFLALPYFLIPFYRFIDPPFSALMARQFLTGTSIRHRWVDLEDISPALPAAVIVSEDGAFCRHWGVDWRAVGAAIDEAEDGEGFRGASTIPMQTAKNLFLWNGFSFVRKLLEVPLAYTMSILWPKDRMLEVYLNIVEWGPGVFGAEAAARYHFGKSAAQLSGREAALMAAALPNPIRRKAGRPNGMTARLAARLQTRVGRESQNASCVLSRGR